MNHPRHMTVKIIQEPDAHFKLNMLKVELDKGGK